MKRKVFYELNPKSFRDSNGDGYGDFQGISDKIDYFTYLGINTIIFQDVLSSTSNNAIQNFSKTTKELGEISEFKSLVEKFNSKNVDVFIELKIGSIKETHRWFEYARNHDLSEFTDIIKFMPKTDVTLTQEQKYDKVSKAYYVVDSETKEVPLNWESSKVLKQFLKIVKFWKSFNISGFVIHDFEFIKSPGKKVSMSEESIMELKRFYNSVKSIDPEMTIIGKSKLIPYDKANNFIHGEHKIFDKFINEKLSFIGTKDENADLLSKFKPRVLAKALGQVNSSNRNIVSFGSNKIGRIVPRWGDDGQFRIESAKSLFILQIMSNASFNIYYGEELGSLNIGLSHYDNFGDDTLIYRKRILQANGVSEKDFLKAQVKQNKINSSSLIAWNPTLNGGFSKNKKPYIPPSESYKEINIENQYRDENSVFHFYRHIIKFIKSEKYSEIFDLGFTTVVNKIFSNRNLIHISIVYEDTELIGLINLSNKSIRIPSLGKLSKVLYSSYSKRKYDLFPKKLSPYESLIIDKFSKQAISDVKKQKKKQIFKKNVDLSVNTNKIIEEIKEEKKIIDKILKAGEVSEVELSLLRKNESNRIKDKKTIKQKKQTIINELVTRDKLIEEEQKNKRMNRLERLNKMWFKKKKDKKEVKFTEGSNIIDNNKEEKSVGINYDSESNFDISNTDEILKGDDELRETFASADAAVAKSQELTGEVDMSDLAVPFQSSSDFDDQNDDTELMRLKEKLRTERDERDAIIHGDLSEEEMSQLKEEELAPTTQIDPENVDAFVENLKKKHQ